MASAFIGFAKMVGFHFPLLTIACAISLGAEEEDEKQKANKNNKIIRMVNPEKRKLVSDPRSTETLGIWTDKNVTTTGDLNREKELQVQCESSCRYKAELTVWHAK